MKDKSKYITISLSTSPWSHCFVVLKQIWEVSIVSRVKPKLLAAAILVGPIYAVLPNTREEVSKMATMVTTKKLRK